ncbi:MAG: CHAD domain-containing protein [Burkholderiaceae bacterium]
MFEQEVRFQVPDAVRASVRAEIERIGAVGAGTRLLARYYDTEDALLGRRGAALRLRLEAGEWVQTFKAVGDDPLTRIEYNTPAADAELDLAALAGRPGTGALGDVDGLAALRESLGVLFETEFVRLRTVLRLSADGEVGSVELALDEGQIRAGGQVVPISELEFELLGGDVASLLQAAIPWVERFGLVLLPVSKSERAHRLRNGDPPYPVTTARTPDIATDTLLVAGWARVFDDCFEQISRNALALAAGQGDPQGGHVHQLRVGIRRLRSLEKLVAGLLPAPDPSLSEALRSLFRELGHLRDGDVLGGELLPRIEAAWGGPLSLGSAVAGGEAAAGLCAGTATQRLLLALLARRIDSGRHRVEVTLAGHARRRINRWLRRSRRQAAGFATLSIGQRHGLRKRIKRIRYGISFIESLLTGKRERRLLRSLKRVQQRLGDWGDLQTALARVAPLAPDDAGAAFAQGWLAASLQAMEKLLRAEMRRFAGLRHGL